MKSQVEDAIRERKYRKAMDTYRSKLHVLEERLLREMRDQTNLVALGLPPAMPETSLRILAKTRALSQMGQAQPNRMKPANP